MCLEGASRAGAELLAALPHPELRAHYVWLPMLPADDIDAAKAAAASRPEPRACHYWDGQRALARRLAAALAIGSAASLGVEGGVGVAWDVYLAYGPGAMQIEKPAFWMHQLAVTHAPRLDPEAWHDRVQGLVQML